MRRRFAVAVDGLAPKEQRALIAFLRERGCAWWHWIPNFWLVIDKRGSLSTGQIRDALRLICEDAVVLVLNLSDQKGWSGKGPKGPERNMFEWLRESWPEDD